MSITHSPVQTKKESIFPWSTLAWSFDGDIYPSGYNDIYWSNGNLNFSNDIVYPIESGTENIVGTEYMYWDVTNSGLFLWGSASDCIGNGIVPIAVAIEHTESGQEASLRVFQGPGLNITADNIATNTLSAISADIGDITAGTITGLTITGGVIQTDTGTGQRIVLDGASNQLNFYDDSNNEIITIDDNIFDSTPGILLDEGIVYAYKSSILGSTQIIGGYIRVEAEAIGPLFYCLNDYFGDTDSIGGFFYTHETSAWTYGRNRTGVEIQTELGHASNTSNAIGLNAIASTLGSGYAIAAILKSTDIVCKMKYDDTYYVDFSVDADGYLNITPTGDILRLWESAGGAGDYADLYSDLDGYLNIKPAGSNLVLWQASGGHRTDLWADFDGYFNIKPQGDKIVIWESGEATGDSVQMWADTDGYFNIKPDGDILRLWESVGGVGDYADFYVDTNGDLTIDANGNNVKFPSDHTIYIGTETVLDTGDVDDTPVNGITTFPISSNWAYDHINDSIPSHDKIGVAFENRLVATASGANTRLTWGTEFTTAYIELQDTGTKFIINATTVDVTSDLNVTGAYEMDGAEIIDSSGYQTGVLKTRQTLLFGYAASITANDEGIALDAVTVDGSKNGQGYRMLRAGTVSGVSVQCDVTNATSSGTFTIKVQKNAVNQTMTVAPVITSIGDTGAYSTSNTFTIIAGDRINVELDLDVSGDIVAVENIAVIVEFMT